MLLLIFRTPWMIPGSFCISGMQIYKKPVRRKNAKKHDFHLSAASKGDVISRWQMGYTETEEDGIYGRS